MEHSSLYATSTFSIYFISSLSVKQNFIPVFIRSQHRHSPTISQTSWLVCLQSARIASWTFAMFSGVVLVDGRTERSSSSSTDVRPSLKRLYHKKLLLWLKALSPKVSYSNWWVSATDFFKIETKFDADSLHLKIRHISCKKKNL